MIQTDIPVAIRTPLMAFDAAGLISAIDAAAISGITSDPFKSAGNAPIIMARFILQITDAPSAAKLRALYILTTAGVGLPTGIA